MVPVEDPENVGFSSQRLERVEALLRSHSQNQRLMGSVTLIARRGKLVHCMAHGFQNAEAGQPMTVRTRFRLASSGKPITAAAVLLLVEEGKLRLSDPVARFLPEFAQSQVAVERQGNLELIPAERQITIHDLLTHTAGLGSDGIGARQVAPQVVEPHGRDTLTTYAKRLSTVPLDFQPGSQWRYSGIAGFDLLARVIEIAADQPFPDFLQERLFTPLGMTETTFLHRSEEEDSTMASVYQPASEGTKTGEKMRRVESGLKLPLGYYSGSAGLASTAMDLNRFLQMLVAGGQLEGTQVLSPRTVELLSANHVGALYRDGLGFGLGVEVVLDPARADTYRSAGSYAWYGAYGTYAWVDPREQLVGIFLQQAFLSPMIEGILRDFETAVMQALVELA